MYIHIWIRVGSDVSEIFFLDFFTIECKEAQQQVFMRVRFS